MEKKRLIKGALVDIVGDHPHTGKTVEFVEMREIKNMGSAPVFADSDGIEFFVFDRKNIRWKRK